MRYIYNEVTKHLLEGEKAANANIKSPFVVKIEDIIQTPEYCYIVMEICNGGTLKDYIIKKGK